MSCAALQDGGIHYRLALVEAGADHVFAARDGARYRLPDITIARGTRPAREIQAAIFQRWNTRSVILDFCHDDVGSPLCIVEVLEVGGQNNLHNIPFTWLPASELADQARKIVRDVAAGNHGARGPFSRAGWIDDAKKWLSDVTGFAVFPEGIEQFNANGNFALVRLRTRGGPAFWLKATGAPNRHEFPVTAILAKFCPEYLPPIVSMRPDWNAWLMADGGEPLGERCAPELLAALARSVADLEKRSILHVDELLKAGAADQRIHILQSNIAGTIAYLEEAMETQTSTKVARVDRLRLHEIGRMLEDACSVIEYLGIPNTVFHNDLNRTNIVTRGNSCLLLDWAEACVGIPFIALEQLLLLIEEDQTVTLQKQIRDAYKSRWLDSIDERKIDDALALMPLLAPYAHLLGPGDWLHGQQRNDPRVQSYARALARYMDRAVKNTAAMDILSGCEAL